MEVSLLEICNLREKIVRLEEKIVASDKALELARGSLSRNNVIAVITIIISVVALLTKFIK